MGAGAETTVWALPRRGEAWARCLRVPDIAVGHVGDLERAVGLRVLRTLGEPDQGWQRPLRRGTVGESARARRHARLRAASRSERADTRECTRRRPKTTIDSPRSATLRTGPVCAMLCGALLANVGVLPPPGPHYTTLQSAVVSLATPLLLLSADLRVILRETSRLLAAFALGSAATALGAVASFAVLSSTMGHGPAGAAGDGWKLAAALTAKNVGGGINYVAVATTLGVSPAAFAAGITADNVFALLYFPVVSWLGGTPGCDLESGNGGKGVRAEDEALTGTGEAAARTGTPSVPPSVGDVVRALTLACVMVATASRVAPPGIGVLPTTTAFAVAFATMSPARWTAGVAPAGDILGNALLFVFFASAGAAGGPVTAVLAYPSVFGFLSVLYVVHLGVMLLVGRGMMGFALPEVLVASNANVGGPATAGALAAGKGWGTLVMPGMLVGNFGNAIGTFVGLGLGRLFEGMVP